MADTFLDYGTIMNLALDVLQKHNITKPPVAADELARKLGFSVLCAELNPGYVAGYIDIDNNEIVVNSDDVPVQQNFTIAHELGHYLLKHFEKDDYKENYSVLLRDARIDEDSSMEQEASWFAESLLVPVDFLFERIAKYPFVTDQSLARMFGVPVTVICDKAAKIRRTMSAY